MFPFSEFSINSTILHGNQSYLQHLHGFLASVPEVGEDSSWLLCYNATSHGWKAKTFHDNCDGKDNTVHTYRKANMSLEDTLTFLGVRIHIDFLTLKYL